MSHRGHPDCVFTTKRACELAAKVEMGKCAAMTDKGEECSHWGIDRVEERPYCGQHINSVLLKADNDRRAATKRAELDERITGYMAWRADHPSVHDTMREA